MKTIKPKYLLWTITIFLLWNCRVQAQNLKLEISLSKEAYLKAEPIWLDVTLTNVSQDTARAWDLCLPCQMGFEVIVRDERGDTMEYSGLLYDMKIGAGWVMMPSESQYECLDLSEYFGDPPEPRAPLASFTFTKSLKPGKYVVVAKHHIRSQTISSNELAFAIRPPKGEEQEGYRLLHAAYLAWIQGKSHSIIQDTLCQIIKSYPKSPYAEKAFRHLPQPNDELFLERFPNSGYSQGAIRAITSDKSDQEKRKFLQKIMKRNPGTRSAKFAEQMLRGW
jgi:hypothetical protein